MNSDSEPDPRAERPDICGVTEIGGTGIEWICIKKVHGAIYRRKTSSQSHRRGETIYSNNPAVDAHYFVPRWPNRDKEDS